MAVGLGILEFEENIARGIGFPRHVLRFLVSVFLAYPLGFFYRAVIQSRRPNVQHVYFSVCGIGIMYYCFGWNCLHSLTNIFMAYSLIRLGGPTTTTVVLSFILNMAYLHVAYYVRSFDEFMLDWSVPHCILCLRLTGIAWDYHDGNNYNNNEISDDMKTTRITNPPSFLEMTGFCYFFGGVLVGPQFPLRKYLALVDGTLEDKGVDSSKSIPYALQRLVLGLVYITLCHLFIPFYRADYFLSEWFENISVLRKIWFTAWFNEVLWMKYLGLFLLSEGGCIVTGLGYNGKTDRGEPKWDGVANIQIFNYETAYSVQQVIQAFHLQTSLWLVRYVYKRLKFLGNKVLSLAASQLFLAVWHGTQPGYYGLFFCQFVYVVFEKSIIQLWDTCGWKKVPEFPLWLQCIVIPFLLIQKQFMLGCGSMNLALLELNKIHKAGMAMYYIPMLMVILWLLVIYPFVAKPLIKSRKTKVKSS